MSEPQSWKPGDRVIVRLPDKSAPYGRMVDVHGTVQEVDEPDLPPGVRVHLDREVNGLYDCYAAHGELRPEVPGE